MSDEKKPHKPVLRPLDERAITQQRRKKNSDPEFSSEDYRPEKIKPPYILILILLLIILSSFWKIAVHKGGDPEAEYAAIQKQIEEKRLEKKLFIERNIRGYK